MENLLEKLEINNWEKEILKKGLDFSLRLLGLFPSLDEELAKRRDPNLKLIGKRKRILFTLFGSRIVERRLYKDQEGRSLSSWMRFWDSKKENAPPRTS